MGAQHVSDRDFSVEVLSSPQITVVDFWAEWCGPCKAFAPVYDEVAAEVAGRFKLVKMNVDESPQSPGKYNIRGIPTIIAFKDGKPVATKVGGMTKAQLTAWLDGIAA